MDGQPYQLDCPRSQQLWPAYAGPGVGFPVVGYFKHGDVVHARAAAADGWLELPRRQGFLKALDPERARFLQAQQNGYRELLDSDAQEDDGVGDALFGWHQVLTAEGLHMVPLSQLQHKQLYWCGACGESLHNCEGSHALALGCGHAFHPGCVGHRPSPNICSACHTKCTPASTPLPPPATPTAPPAATLHFSALPSRTHRRLLLTLLVLTSVALLHANHGILGTIPSYTLFPLHRLGTRLLTFILCTVCALPRHALRSPIHAYNLICWLLSTVLWLPGALLRALYHSPSTAYSALAALASLATHYTRIIVTNLHPLALLGLGSHHTNRLSTSVSSFWDGYWRWLPAALGRQLQWCQIPLGVLFGSWVPGRAAEALLAAAREMPAAVWAVECAEQLRAVADAAWWEDRSPEVAAVVGRCQEWVAGWGPGSTVACGVALLAVVGLCVAGRKVRI